MGKLTVMMPVWNEENGFLSESLKDLSEYVDEIVILDDASTDSTVKLCKSFKKTIVHVLPQNLGWIDKGEMRQKLYNLTIVQNPNWILCPDADEIWENRFKTEVRKMMEGPYNWYSFYRVHFWTRDSYFETNSPKMRSLRLMFRFVPSKPRAFLKMPIHGARTPAWVFQDNLNGRETDIRIKHFGFVRKEQRLRRIELNRKFNQKWYLPYIETLEKRPPVSHKWIEP